MTSKHTASGYVTREERELLALGLIEWGGPAKPTDEIARAIGFRSVDDLLSRGPDLADRLRSDLPVGAAEWRSALLATELVFASDAVGSGRDWLTTTGYTDEETLVLLRSLQAKLTTVVAAVQAAPPSAQAAPLPAWEVIDFDWTGFIDHFQFRSRAEAGRSIVEPAPFATFDLGTIFNSDSGFAAGRQAVNALALLAMTRVFDENAYLLALDWQHPCYRFWPQRHALADDPQWMIEVFPDGDYYAFVTEDLSCGTFGHPWEQTLCVFGEPLLSALTAALSGWLPLKRSAQ